MTAARLDEIRSFVEKNVAISCKIEKQARLVETNLDGKRWSSL